MDICKSVGEFLEKYLFIPRKHYLYYTKDTGTQLIVRVSVDPFAVFENEFVAETFFRKIEKNDIFPKLKSFLSIKFEIPIHRISYNFYDANSVNLIIHYM